jgi:hypothetical protein
MSLGKEGPAAGKNQPCEVCRGDRRSYLVPSRATHPPVLLDLTEAEQAVLAPLQVEFTKLQRMGPYGYMKAHGAPRISTKKERFNRRAARAGNKVCQQRVLAAHTFLLESCEAYRKFEEAIAGAKRTFYALTEGHLECGLYPVLYPSEIYSDLGARQSLTETAEHLRRSIKRSFEAKMFAPVSDYRCNEPLVLLVYYCYVRTLVTSAVNQRLTSPANYLAEKPICSLYYLRQLLCLKDTCRQLGLPSLMVTLAPRDSPQGFGIPKWLNQELHDCGKTVRERGGSAANVHFAHVIMQVAKVLLAGITAKGRPTQNHLLAHDDEKSNVQGLFVRLETQRRLTLHGHILLWVNKVAGTRLEQQLSCETHSSSPLIREWVQTIQCSSKRTRTGRAVIRQYVEEILVGLQSHCDVITGHSESLPYVCTYSSKLAEQLVQASDIDRVSSSDEQERYAAVRDIMDKIEIGVPEAALSLSSISPTYFWGSQLNIGVPTTLEKLRATKWFGAYIARGEGYRELTALSYIRELKQDFSGPRSRGRPKVVSVGFSLLPHTNPRHYLQYLALHSRYDNETDLQGDSDTPEELRYARLAFARCGADFETENLRARLLREGNTKHFVAAADSAVRAFKKILEHTQNWTRVPRESAILPTPNAEQAAILETVLQGSRARPYVILGRAGTGKSNLLFELVRLCELEGRSVLYSCPTGRLTAEITRRFRALGFARVKVDTCHRAFGLELTRGAYSVRHHALEDYDVVLVDELSMLTARNAERIVDLIGRSKPGILLVFAGDLAQLPPPGVSSAERVSRSQTFWTKCFPRITLRTQVRSEDERLKAFLDIVRSRTPSFKELKAFVDNRSIDRHWYLPSTPSDQAIQVAAEQYPLHKWLVFSNEAVARVNKVKVELDIKRRLEKGLRVLDVFTFTDAALQVVEAVRGTPVMLTENLDIGASLCNGELFTLYDFQPHAVTLQDAYGTFHVVAPQESKDTSELYFPIRIAYASTVHKAQGATLAGVILWLDTDHPDLTEGVGYVGCSRVRSADDLVFFGHVRTRHFRPVLF